MAPTTATWKKLAAADPLQRSSHNVSAAGSTVYVFGGELKPREPRDNDVHSLNLNGSASVMTSKAAAEAPSARVGSASATIGNTIYFFSGRGGPEMAPIDEDGAVWALDTTSNRWEMIRPFNKTRPEARSYHAAATDREDIYYVHAGCPEKGRLSDLWAFSISKKEWTELASAPNPARGGTSIAWAEGKLYRMNGFDGKHEVGGALDVYDPDANSWSTISFEADGEIGPGARSVAALIPVKIGGKTNLVTLFGESDPSSLGHQGAGKMLSDIWTYSLEKGVWSVIHANSKDGVPDARGWFDADAVAYNGSDSIVVAGGLGEDNNRLNDIWALSF